MAALLPALLPLLLALSGPAGAASSVQVEPVGLNDVKLSLGSASFDLVLRVERTRGLPVRLRKLDYALQVGKVRVTQARADYRHLKLRKGQPVDVELPVRLDAGQAAAVALDAFGAGQLTVRISGKAGVSVLLLPISVGFDERLVKLGT